MLPDLLGQIPGDQQIGTLTGDGAFNTRRCHTAILERGGTAIIPIRKDGRLWKEDCPAAMARNDILRATRRLGRAIWKRWTGYHVRSRIEANPLMVRSQTTAGQRMHSLKAFGERIAARDPDRRPPKSTSASPSSNASTHSAPPRSNAWYELTGIEGSLGSSVGSATTSAQSTEALEGTQSFTAVGMDEDSEFSLPMRLGLTNLFQHQSHHRGQVHHMISHAGEAPPPLDVVKFGRGDGDEWSDKT